MVETKKYVGSTIPKPNMTTTPKTTAPTTPVPRPGIVPAPPSASTPKPTTSTTVPKPGMSGPPAPTSYAAPPASQVPKPPGTVPKPPAPVNPVPAPPTGANEHQAYINKPGQTYGGVSGYASSQQQRYNQAIASGDQNLANRLVADAARVGYTLSKQGSQSDTGGVPQPPQPVTNPGAFTPDVPTTEPIPTPEQTIPAMDWEAIQKYADEQIAAELLRQKSAAEQAINAGKLTTTQQLEALRTAAERLKGNINEDRGIENVQNARRLSPFSGKSDFALGMIERERGKTDRQLAENQQTQEANINANLAQLENEIHAKLLAIQQTSGAERERLIQSLRDSERQYDLQAAQMEINRGLANSQIKNTDFNQDLSKWQANRGAYEWDASFGYGQYKDMVDWTGNVPQGGYSGPGAARNAGFAAAGQSGGTQQGGAQRTLAGQALDMQGKQANWNAYLDMVDRTGNLGSGPKSDWGQLPSSANSGAPTLQREQFQEQIRQFGIDTALKQAGLEQDAKQFAASQGLQWASLSQRQKEFAAEQAMQSQQQSAQQLQQGLSIFESTGQMPDWMSQYGINVNALNQPQTRAEIEGLYSELMSGATNPDQALKRIDDAVKLGLKDSATANELKNSIYMLYPEVSPESKREQEVRNTGLNAGIQAVLKNYFGIR